MHAPNLPDSAAGQPRKVVPPAAGEWAAGPVTCPGTRSVQCSPPMSATEARPLPRRAPTGPPAAGPARPPAPPRAAAVIPARDEAPTVGAVVYAALDARLVDEVVVVDNGSVDGTAAVAQAHGARVVQEPRPGKGQALRAGVAATDAEIVVFLDADLVGLRPDHVDALVAAVAGGGADMACGLFDRGPVANRIFLGPLPVLTGQRALRRSLFSALALDDVRGYRVEAALNTLVARHELRRDDRVLDGLWHRTKEEKAPHPAVGLARKVAMLLEACWSYARLVVVPPVPSPLPAPDAHGSSRGRS
jgi:molybdopterin-guanine dinucleotide biosynthesis protein A